MQHDHEETLKFVYLTFVLDAQKYRLQMSIHDIFSIVNKKTALQLGKLEKLSHPSISILTPVLGAQKNRLNEAIPLSIHNMFSITNIRAKFQLIKQ